jgi:hypothetical protein
MQDRALSMDLLYVACAVVLGLALAIEAWTTNEALLVSPVLWLGVTAAVVLGILILNA